MIVRNLQGVNMFKKIIMLLLPLFVFVPSAFADEVQDVQAFFNSFVNASNTYATNIPNYYVKNAKIVRVVYKPDGTKQAVVIPFDRYLQELKKGAALARTVRYKNRYENQKVTKVGNDYKLSAIRIPRNDKSGLPAYFIITKTQNGWKIKEESMGTNVQKFLEAK